VTFDQDMFTGVGIEPGSVVNPANYVLTGRSTGPVPFDRVFYVAATHTAFLTFPALQADEYTLTVSHLVTSSEATPMLVDFTATFKPVSAFSYIRDIRFATSRSDRANDTVSWDVKVTNRSTFDVFLPLVLILDPAQGYQGVPQGASGRAPDGR